MRGKKVKQLRRTLTEVRAEDDSAPPLTNQGFRNLKKAFGRERRVTKPAVRAQVAVLVDQDIRKRFFQMTPKQREALIERVMKSAVEEITDEMWDAIFGKKGKALEGPADVPQEDWDSKHEREESSARR